jgi:alpha-galactosidase
VPIQLAAIMRSNINVQELAVAASLTGNRDHIYHAAAMDPHTAAELSLAEIEKLVDALIVAHGAMLPVFTRNVA